MDAIVSRQTGPPYCRERPCNPTIHGGLTMLRKYGVMAGVLAMTFAMGTVVGRTTQVQAAGKNRVLEIRTYTTNEGKLPALVERMGHGEGKVFERLGMKPMLFSVAAEAPKSQNTFVYILSHESLEKAKENWAKFRDDSEWKEIRAKSEAAGPIVAKAETIFVDTTDFSPVK